MQILGKFELFEGFLLFSTKNEEWNKEKVGEEIKNFGQNIYPPTQIGNSISKRVIMGYDREGLTPDSRIVSLKSMKN